MKRIGITVGDVAGIGPEIVLKAIGSYLNDCVVYGSYDVLNYYNDTFGYGLKLHQIEEVEECEMDCVNIIDPFPIRMNQFDVGKVSPLCGQGAFEYLKKAIEDASEKKIAAIGTAPLNKEALHLSGNAFAGHTEILAKLTNTKSYSMLLWSSKLKTIHVSTHVSLREACDRCKKEKVEMVIGLADQTLRKAGYENPKIAVAGLNPHAGENGLFGKEEIEEIIPAVQNCKERGMNVFGPLPPDTVFLRALKGEFDIVVAMYHDQGHIPLKLLAFDGGVNMTVGLPFIRTSVDHGTAFDIAGKNIANIESMIETIKSAMLFSK